MWRGQIELSKGMDELTTFKLESTQAEAYGKYLVRLYIIRMCTCKKTAELVYFSPFFSLKPRLNDQTFSSNIVFVAHNMGWLNKQTMFEHCLNKLNPHNAFFVLPLKLYSDVTQIRSLIGCFFPLGLAFRAEVAIRSNICS